MHSRSRTNLATAAALACFAGNSILCRLALGRGSIDAWSYTFVRLASGALTLFLLVRFVSGKRAEPSGGSFGSAFALFAYAIAFSLAYLRVGAGVGALVLFASVQATMIGWSVRAGTRPSALEWLGLAIAMGGLALLTLRGSMSTDPVGLGLMMIAGVAWGAYSLRGRGSRSPLAGTAANFARSVPFALVALLLGLASGYVITARGVALAAASGAIASGLGYSLWYLALPALTATRAAVLQLIVPVIAAVAGVVLLDEKVTTRLVIAGLMILGGVATAVLTRRKAPVAVPSRT